MHENAFYIIVNVFTVWLHSINCIGIQMDRSLRFNITCNNSNKKLFYRDFFSMPKVDFYILFSRAINQCDKREKKHRIRTTELHRFDDDDDEFV